MACATGVICLFSIIFRTHRGMHYAVLGLFVDFVIRLVAGRGPSPLAQLVHLFTARAEPQFAYGKHPPPLCFSDLISAPSSAAVL